MSDAGVDPMEDEYDFKNVERLYRGRIIAIEAERDALQQRVAEMEKVMRVARAELVEAGIGQNCNYNDLLASIDACLPVADDATARDEWA